MNEQLRQIYGHLDTIRALVDQISGMSQQLGAPKAAEHPFYSFSQAYVVIGQHRSGTSALARVMHELDCHMGSLFRRPDDGNPLGYWEDLVWRNLNKTILNAAGGTWYTPPSSGAIEDVCDHPDIAYLIHALAHARQLVYPIWGFKDPRTALTIHGMRKHLPHNTKYIIIQRHQMDIVASLQRRSGLRGYNEPYQHWYDLTAYYAQQIKDFRWVLTQERGEGHIWQLTYDELLADPVAVVSELSWFMDVGRSRIAQAADTIMRKTGGA